jgi:PAS domain S-box-containing protein
MKVAEFEEPPEGSIPSEQEQRRIAARQALGALTTMVPAGVIAVDAEGRSWYHSKRWEDFSGCTGISFRDRPWYEALHPDDVEAVAERWLDRQSLRGRLGRFRTIGADGMVRECWAEAIPMISPDGDIEGYIIVLSDSQHAGHGAGAPADGEEGASLGRLPGGPVLSNVELMDAVLNRASDFITIFNADGTWRWSSGGAIRLVGHQVSFDPVAGFMALIHRDDAALAAELYERALADDIGPEERFELRLRAADGSWVHTEIAFDVLLDDPAVRGVVVHGRDVTSRHEALERIESTNRRLVSLVTNVRSAVVLVDEDRRIVVANDAFVEMFRLPVPHAVDLEGKTMADMGVDIRRLIAEPSDAAERSEQVIRGREPEEQRRITLVDGRILEVDFVPVYVRDEFRGHLSSFRDVTDQARAEAEQERLLESEREENQRLAEMDSFRTERLATVSHELRTPLTSIVGYTHLLREVLEAKGEPQEMEYLEAIVRNVNRLLRLAGDLVALDSLESRTLPLHVVPVDVAATVCRALETVEPSAAAASVELSAEVKSGPPVDGDVDRLGQLFENLLTNAIKFTPAGGKVTVRASRGRDGWVVEVSDTGIGIPAGERQFLFSRFFRASNARQRGLPGTGLGLSVSRAIVDLHEGSIDVESEVGAGTTVRVTLRGAEADGA